MGSYLNNGKQYRGIALVIGIEKFDTRQGQKNIDRLCCPADIKMMSSMFEKLDFFVECFKDLNAAQIREKVLKASQDPRNKDCQCFVLVISTHGREVGDKKEGLWHHEVMGSDRNYVMVEDLLEMFDGQNAPELDGKAKMFFIQACRSKDIKNPRPDHGLDRGLFANVMKSKSSDYDEKWISKFNDDNFNVDCDDIYKGWERDKQCWIPVVKKPPGPQEGPSGDSGGSPDINPPPPEPLDVPSVKCPKDCLIYYPTESGYYAFRNEHGSYMFQFMNEQFPKLLRGCNIITYLTYVNMALSNYTASYLNRKWKVTGSYWAKMSGHVVFQPMTENSPMAKAVNIMNKKCTLV